MGPDGYQGIDLEQLLGSPEVPSAIRDLIRPGKDVKELLMRTRITAKELKHIVRLLYKAERFELKPLKDFLLNYLSAKTSEEGLSRREVVQIACRMVVPSWEPVSSMDGLRARKRRFESVER